MSGPAVVVPTLGAPSLGACLEALRAQVPPLEVIVVVASGPAAGMKPPAGVEVLRSPRRLGFAAAVNRGLGAAAGTARVAVLNDDAVPEPGWLATLEAALDDAPRAAAVQGTVTDAGGRNVDGRGIALDRWGLPVQVDRGRPAEPEPAGPLRRLAVSATAALFCRSALDEAALSPGVVFDESFGSYHEDLDLGLRLGRLGRHALWVPGAPCRHLGSVSGRGMPWYHPWWILANRWRALAGNLDPGGLARSLPRLLRGELRAVNTLRRANRRALLVALAVAAAWPYLVGRALVRTTPGERLGTLPTEIP